VGGIAFIAGVIFVLMGMGHWQDTGNPGWLTAAIIVALFTLIGGVKSLFKRGK
jgi:hypothetical protein